MKITPSLKKKLIVIANHFEPTHFPSQQMKQIFINQVIEYAESDCRGIKQVYGFIDGLLMNRGSADILLRSN
jgi:hypothetical protein